ncbi:hypothetical protein OHC33_004911 [Knufia fluminis]|uniref:Uncharacterized protein n=1 Tax=Knufia fluminis TaxID=191047 RepID=A0AAN8ELY9_9EURO|nr:hypothetical protein OHC33_004911 [Knufia fluminis]
MDPVGVVASIASLVVSSTRLIQLANDVTQKHKGAPLIMSSIATEWNNLNNSLVQVQGMLLNNSLPSFTDAGQAENVRRDIDDITMSCARIVSKLEVHVIQAMKQNGISPLEATDSVNFSAKTKFVWNETEVNQLMEALRGQKSSLTLLFQTLAWQAREEDARVLREQNTFIINAFNRFGRRRWSALSGSTARSSISDPPKQMKLKYYGDLKDDIDPSRYQPLSSTSIPTEALHVPDDRVEAENFPHQPPDVVPDQVVSQTEESSSTQTMSNPAESTPTSLGRPTDQPRHVLPTESGKLEGTTTKAALNTVGARLKCVIVGDRECGKTETLITIATGALPTEYIPTVFDNYSAEFQIDGKEYNLGLHDTSCQEDYDRLRPLSYPQTDVFILIFSVISPPSFENVRSKWYPEIQYHTPGVPIILVGNFKNKRDDAEIARLLADKDMAPVEAHEGLQLAIDIRADQYLECDSEVGPIENFSTIAKAAIGAALNSAPNSKNVKNKKKRSRRFGMPLR